MASTPVPPRRILIVRFSHLGDVVCTLSLHHALHAAFPKARIAWAVQREYAPLLEGLPGLAQVVRFDRRGGPGAWFALRRELRRFDADLAVDAQGNLKSAAATLASGAKRRAGMARADWREPLGSLVLTERAHAASAAEPHILQRVNALIESLVRGPSGDRRYDVGLTPEELRRGRAWLRSVTIGGPNDASKPPSNGVLLHLSNPADVRAWPEARWSELLECLEGRGVGPVLVLSGPNEESLGQRLARTHSQPRWGGAKHLVGQRDLRRLAALFSAAAQAGWVLVSGDTGPMHLAWSHGLRVILLAGPQAAARTGPWPTQRHRTVRAQRALDCAPCLARRCRHPEGPVCMAEISAEEVCRAVEDQRGSP